MKYYLRTIQVLQQTLIGGSVFFLMSAPILKSFYPEYLPESYTTMLYLISLLTVTFVMAIRPLADLLPRFRWLRMLVILRKGFGVASASIIVSFMLSKIMLLGPIAYLATWLSAEYWSLDGFALLAHLGDVTAVILLLTSNNFSKRMLGKGWKRVQKFAYVYFYAGALYEVFTFGSSVATASVIVVTMLVLGAFVRNRLTPRRVAVKVASTPVPASSEYRVRAPSPHL